MKEWKSGNNNNNKNNRKEKVYVKLPLRWKKTPSITVVCFWRLLTLVPEVTLIAPVTNFTENLIRPKFKLAQQFWESIPPIPLKTFFFVISNHLAPLKTKKCHCLWKPFFSWTESISLQCHIFCTIFKKWLERRLHYIWRQWWQSLSPTKMTHQGHIWAVCMCSNEWWIVVLRNGLGTKIWCWM